MLTKAQRDAYRELANMWRRLGEETGRHRQRVEAWTRRTAAGSSAAAVSDPDDKDAVREPALGAN